MTCVLDRMVRSALGLIVSTALLASLFGCSSNDTVAIAALEAINAEALAGGGSKAVRMQKNGEKVGTIYILSDVDRVMPHVGKLRSVKEVYFQGDEFGDKHVQYVRHLSSLISLNASKTKITDEGVKQLSRTKLQALFLDGTAISSAALEPIAMITSLVSLDLAATNIADDLTPLANLKNLEWLLIRDMDLSTLSDDSLTTLAELPKLGRLTVTNTGITQEAVRRLKRARPKMNVEVDAPSDLPIAVAAEEGDDDRPK